LCFAHTPHKMDLFDSISFFANCDQFAIKMLMIFKVGKKLVQCVWCVWCGTTINEMMETTIWWITSALWVMLSEHCTRRKSSAEPLLTTTPFIEQMHFGHYRGERERERERERAQIRRWAKILAIILYTEYMAVKWIF
jgi:hypothetical protein